MPRLGSRSIPRSLVFATLAALLYLATCPAPTSATDFARRADAIVRPFADAGVYQGVVLLADEDEILFHGAYGRASIELDVPNRLDTRFQIASVSKPFTATAVLLLAERGEVDLEAPLSAILPDYPGGDRLTLDDLLTHTSGIPNVNSFDDYPDWSRRNWATAAELVALFRDEPLEMEPGTEYSYSNSNYNLLAHVVEVVSGESFGTFLEENVFAPAGMRDTRHRADPTWIVPRLATGYAAHGARDFRRPPYLDWTIKTGNGSLYSTTTDLLRFHRALGRDEILSRETLEAAYGFDRELGRGWFPGEYHGQRAVTMTGRSPGYTSHYRRFIDSGHCLVILSNLYLGPPSPMIEDLVALLLDAPFEASDFRVDSELAGEELDPFAGTYAFGDDWYVGAVTVIVENRTDHLAVVYLDGDNAGYELVLVSLGGRRFFDRTHGGMVRFEPGAAPNDRLRLVYSYGSEKVAEPIEH